MTLVTKDAPAAGAACVVTGQITQAGYRLTFSIDNVRSAEEGGYVHFALDSPGYVSGRVVDEYYEDPDDPRTRYESLDDVPKARRADLGWINRLVFKSIPVNETVVPGTVAVSLQDVASEVARDGRSGWLIWNPKGEFEAPVGGERIELVRPCRIRIPGGETADQVSARIMLGGATPVRRRIALDGEFVEVVVDQMIIPPVGGAWARIREARASGLR